MKYIAAVFGLGLVVAILNGAMSLTQTADTSRPAKISRARIYYDPEITGGVSPRPQR